MDAAKIAVICVIGQDYVNKSIRPSIGAMIQSKGYLIAALESLVKDQYVLNEGDKLLLTEKGQVFFEALQSVPEPVATWTMPWNVE